VAESVAGGTDTEGRDDVGEVPSGPGLRPRALGRHIILDLRVSDTDLLNSERTLKVRGQGKGQRARGRVGWEGVVKDRGREHRNSEITAEVRV
jgi:hypothetical protein